MIVNGMYGDGRLVSISIHSVFIPGPVTLPFRLCVCRSLHEGGAVAILCWINIRREQNQIQSSTVDTPQRFDDTYCTVTSSPLFSFFWSLLLERGMRIYTVWNWIEVNGMMSGRLWWAGLGCDRVLCCCLSLSCLFVLCHLDIEFLPITSHSSFFIYVALSRDNRQRVTFVQACDVMWCDMSKQIYYVLDVDLKGWSIDSINKYTEVNYILFCYF